MNTYKFFKKAMSAFLTLSLLITGISLPQGVFAAASGIWTNIAAEYDNNDCFFIESSEDMDAFIASINAGKDYAGKTVYLLADVTSTEPAQSDKKFSGHFLGLNHIVTLNNSLNVGVFGSLYSAEVESLKIKGSNLKYAVAFANLGGDINNCVAEIGTVSAGIEIADSAYIGGLVSVNSGIIVNCSVFGDLLPSHINSAETENVYIGGIAALNSNTGTITDSYFVGTLGYSGTVAGQGAISFGGNAPENCYYNADKYTAVAGEAAEGLTTFKMTDSPNDTQSLTNRLNGGKALGSWIGLDPLTFSGGVTERSYPVPLSLCGLESKKLYYKEFDGIQKEIYPIATEADFKAWNGVGDAVLLNSLEFSSSDFSDTGNRFIIENLDGTLFGNGKKITFKCNSADNSYIFENINGEARDACIVSERADGAVSCMSVSFFRYLFGTVSSCAVLGDKAIDAPSINSSLIKANGILKNCVYFARGVPTGETDSRVINTYSYADVRDSYVDTDNYDGRLAYRIKFLSGMNGAIAYFPMDNDAAKINPAWKYTDLTSKPVGAYKVEYPVPVSVYEAVGAALPYENLYYDGTKLSVPTDTQQAVLNTAGEVGYIEIADGAKFYDIINTNGADKKYRLTADISVTVDLSAEHPMKEQFAGELDGSGHTITLRTTGNGVLCGLFDTTYDATIHDFTIDVSQKGVLAMVMQNSSVNNVNVIGNLEITDAKLVGIIGTAKDTDIIDCESSASLTVIGITENVGGLVGKANNCRFENVKNSGKVTVVPADGQPFAIGGIVGCIEGGSLISSKNSGEICVNTSLFNADRYVGGIAGKVSDEITIGELHNCGAIAVNKTFEIGGIIGSVQLGSTAYFCGELTNNAAIKGEYLDDAAESCSVGGIFGSAKGVFVGGLQAENYGDISDFTIGAGVCANISADSGSPKMKGRLVNYGTVTSAGGSATGVAAFGQSADGCGELKLINHGRVSVVNGDASGVFGAYSGSSVCNIIAENTANVSASTNAAGIAIINGGTFEYIRAVNSGKVSCTSSGGGENQFAVNKETESAPIYIGCTVALYGAASNTTPLPNDRESGNVGNRTFSLAENAIVLNDAEETKALELIKKAAKGESLTSDYSDLSFATQKLSGAIAYAFPVPDGCETFVTAYVAADNEPNNWKAPTYIESGTDIGSGGIYALAFDTDDALTASVANFSGVLLGDGHSVNLNMSGTNNGLFDTVNGGSVVNLITRGSVSSNTTYVGSAIGLINTGVADKLINIASVTGCPDGDSSREQCVGGNIGCVSVELSGICLENYGKIDGVYRQGGNIAVAASTVTDAYLRNFGTVGGDGGAAGNISEANGAVSDCDIVNGGAVIAKSGFAGGNIGTANSVSGCTIENKGQIVSGNRCGGNIASAYSINSTVLKNLAQVTGTAGDKGDAYVGGNIGHLDLESSSLGQNWYNAGNVAGRKNVGGMVGSVTMKTSGGSLTLKNCLFTGNLRGCKNIGTVVGYTKDLPLTISSCYYTNASALSAVGFAFDKAKVTESDCEGCSKSEIIDSFFSMKLNENSSYVFGLDTRTIDMENPDPSLLDRIKFGWTFDDRSYPVQTAFISAAEASKLLRAFFAEIQAMENKTRTPKNKIGVEYNNANDSYYLTNDVAIDGGFVLTSRYLGSLNALHANSFLKLNEECERVFPMIPKTVTTVSLALAEGQSAEQIFSAVNPANISLAQNGDVIRITDYSVGGFSKDGITCRQAGTAMYCSFKRESLNKLPSSAALKFTVKKADIAYTVDDYTTDYDGTGKMLTVTPSDTDIVAAVTYGENASSLSADYKLTDAGAHTVHYSIAPTNEYGKRNYNVTAGSHALTIAAIAPALTLGASGNTTSGITLTAGFGNKTAGKDWNGKFSFYEGTALLASDITIDAASKNAVYTVPANVSGGTHNYRVAYVPGENDNYLQSDLTIAYDPAKVNQTGFDLAAINATYGDTGLSASAVGGQSSGGVHYSLVSGDCVTIGVSGNVAILGAGAATIKAVRLSDDYYNEICDTATVNIRKFTPTVEISDKTTVYNGAAVVLSGSERPTVTLANGDTVDYANIDYSYRAGSTGAFTAGLPTNAGDYEVVAKYKATDYYNAASDTMSLTISPLTASITWSEGELSYDGTEKSVAASVSNKIGDDSFEITYSGVTEATNAGNYNASISDLGNRNYILPSGGAMFDWKISPSQNSVTLLGFEGAYDRLPHSVIVSGASENDVITYSTDNVTFSEVAPSFTDAGSYTVYVRVDCVNRVDFSGSAEVVIDKAVPIATSSIGAGYLTNGGTLSGCSLYGAFSTAGTLSWSDSTAVVTESGEFEAVFVPDDTDNYETVTLLVYVYVYQPMTPKDTIEPLRVENGTEYYEVGAESAAEVIAEVCKGFVEGEKAHITVNMGDSSTLGAGIINAMKGSNAVVELKMKTADGIEYSWTIDASTIDADAETASPDMSIKLGGDNIPEEKIESFTEQLGTIGDSVTLLPLSLSHDGKFGFAPVLKLNVGLEMAGKKLVLVYYNPETGELEQASEPIEVGENGDVLVPFGHASEYLLVVMDSSAAAEFESFISGTETPIEPNEPIMDEEMPSKETEDEQPVDNGDDDLGDTEDESDDNEDTPVLVAETEITDDGEETDDADKPNSDEAEKGAEGVNPPTGVGLAIPSIICAATVMLIGRKRRRG